MKNKISIYAASNNAIQIISRIRSHYNITEVIDSLCDNTGKLFEGYEIKGVNEISRDTSVIITNNNIESSIETLYNSRYGMDDLWFARPGDGFVYICKYIEKTKVVLDNLLYSLFNPEEAFFIMDEMKKVSDSISTDMSTKPRIFNICLRFENGAEGGPLACLRNLKMANNEYHIIENLISINLSDICDGGVVEIKPELFTET